jgi:hypothetical protein
LPHCLRRALSQELWRGALRSREGSGSGSGSGSGPGVPAGEARIDKSQDAKCALEGLALVPSRSPP